MNDPPVRPTWRPPGEALTFKVYGATSQKEYLAGTQVITGTATWMNGTTNQLNLVAQSLHSADHHPADYKISMSELLLVIQLKNSGGYHLDAGGEDGCAPGTGSHDGAPHASDYKPPDWTISLSELLRVIQFYNSGGYHADAAGEDGFAPGPQREMMTQPRGHPFALANRRSRLSGTLRR